MSKRSQQLFSLLVEISSNLQSAASLFKQGLSDLGHPEALALGIKRHEAKGDELTAALTTKLNATYITPLDREDFLALSVALDDIVDGLEACTVRFDLYNITQSTPVMVQFADNIVESVNEIAAAMAKLSERKLLAIREHTQKLNRLEKVGDTLLRNSLRTLFTDAADALHVIKMKEIYEILENVTDKCEDVADVLESVIVKNA